EIPVRGRPPAEHGGSGDPDAYGLGDRSRTCCGGQHHQHDGDQRCEDDQRVHQHDSAVEPVPLAHVASPGVAWVVRVKWSTTDSAVSWSSPSILSGPAAEAVVTVTAERPSIRCNGPRTVSTVWIRDIGAMRHSWRNHPAAV